MGEVAGRGLDNKDENDGNNDDDTFDDPGIYFIFIILGVSSRFG